MDFESETFVIGGGQVSHTLRADGFDASEDWTGRGTPLVMTLAIRGREGEPSLEVREDGTANAILTPNGGRGGIGVGAIAIQERAVCDNPDSGPDGAGFRTDDQAYTLEARTVPQSVQMAMAVRRLTPRECERLQGVPDDYTLIPRNGKPMADGPRYKMLGNGFAVPVVRWIGKRIQSLTAS